MCAALVSGPGCCSVSVYGLHGAGDWQEGVPSGHLKPSRFAFELGLDGLVSRAGLGFSQSGP